MEIDKELLKGHIDTLILALLVDKDRYGYEIAKEVREKSADAFELKEGTLYLSLKRLEKKEAVLSYWSDEAAGGARRKYYHLTDAGQTLLQTKRQEWQVVKRLMNQFLGGDTDDQ